ncbi:MAG TPA: arsenate reductase ArsC [Chloroflexota bacterium]|nr:arsenate reductase ArsC [Chloroflexota bacterium]
MAEGWLRTLAGDSFEVFSAGTDATKVRPEAIQVMSERGIDFGSHSSKTLQAFLGQPFDYVITVCDQANEACPNFPGAARRLHWSFPDPSSVSGDAQVRLQAFRESRDAIEARLREFLANPE